MSVKLLIQKYSNFMLLTNKKPDDDNVLTNDLYTTHANEKKTVQFSSLASSCFEASSAAAAA